MASVLLHEISHLALGSNPVTLDHCQGFTGTAACLDLAQDHPDLAVQNADNYRLFIEDGVPSNADLWNYPAPPGFN